MTPVSERSGACVARTGGEEGAQRPERRGKASRHSAAEQTNPETGKTSHQGVPGRRERSERERVVVSRGGAQLRGQLLRPGHRTLAGEPTAHVRRAGPADWPAGGRAGAHPVGRPGLSRSPRRAGRAAGPCGPADPVTLVDGPGRAPSRPGQWRSPVDRPGAPPAAAAVAGELKLPGRSTERPRPAPAPLSVGSAGRATSCSASSAVS